MSQIANFVYILSNLLESIIIRIIYSGKQIIHWCVNQLVSYFYSRSNSCWIKDQSVTYLDLVSWINSSSRQLISYKWTVFRQSSANANPCLNQNTVTWEHRRGRNSISVPWSIKCSDWPNLTKFNFQVRRSTNCISFQAILSCTKEDKFENLSLWSFSACLRFNRLHLHRTAIHV